MYLNVHICREMNGRCDRGWDAAGVGVARGWYGEMKESNEEINGGEVPRKTKGVMLLHWLSP